MFYFLFPVGSYICTEFMSNLFLHLILWPKAPEKENDRGPWGKGQSGTVMPFLGTQGQEADPEWRFTGGNKDSWTIKWQSIGLSAKSDKASFAIEEKYGAY